MSVQIKLRVKIVRWTIERGGKSPRLGNKGVNTITDFVLMAQCVQNKQKREQTSVDVSAEEIMRLSFGRLA